MDGSETALASVVLPLHPNSHGRAGGGQNLHLPYRLPTEGVEGWKLVESPTLSRFPVYFGRP